MSRATLDYSAWNEASAQANKDNAIDYFNAACKTIDDNDKQYFPMDNRTLKAYANRRFELGIAQIIELFNRRPFAFDLNKTPRCL